MPVRYILHLICS